MTKNSILLLFLSLTCLSFGQAQDSTKVQEPIQNNEVAPLAPENNVQPESATPKVPENVPAEASTVPKADTSSKWKRMFHDNFDTYQQSEKERFFVFVQGLNLNASDPAIHDYFKKGFGIGIGTDVFESKRFTLSLSLSYNRFALEEQKVKEQLPSSVTMTSKPMNAIMVLPDLKFRPMIINKNWIPYISLGINSLFTVDYASVEVDGIPTYLTFPAGFYMKPGVGVNFDTQSFGQFFLEANYSAQMLSVKQIKSSSMIQLWSVSLGYRF